MWRKTKENFWLRNYRRGVYWAVCFLYNCARMLRRLFHLNFDNRFFK